MSDKATRKKRDDHVANEAEEVEDAREKEEERGGAKELSLAVNRIREAVRMRKEPRPEDVELAQRYLGNAAVAALLSGRDLEEPKRKEDPEVSGAQGRFKLILYVRERFAQGPFDPGQVFLGLEGDEHRRIYGFHPTQHGASALRPDGVPGEVRVDPAQIVDAQKKAELDLTREQVRAFQLMAESFRHRPPMFDFWKWNSMHFVTEILTMAKLEPPPHVFDGLASSDAMMKVIQPKIEEELPEGEGDGDGDGEEEEETSGASGATPPDKPEDKPEPKTDEKKGFFRNLFGGGKGK
jgi:hypothetical protein